MNSKNILNNVKEQLNQIKSKNKLENLKSNYFLQKIFINLPKKHLLGLIRYNKTIQQRLNININIYKEYSEIYSSIEIEIILNENKYNEFIHINKKEEEIYYHIYFDNNKEDIKRIYLNKEDKVNKINIIINYQIKSLDKLFAFCDCIKSIYFKTFSRNNIINMSRMFDGCSLLKKINFLNFNKKNKSFKF